MVDDCKEEAKERKREDIGLQKRKIDLELKMMKLM